MENIKKNRADTNQCKSLASPRDSHSPFTRIDHHLNPANVFILHDIIEDGPLAPQGDMHFDPQIIIVLSGEFEMCYENYQHSYRPGEICLTGPWEPHAAKIRTPHTRYLVLTIDLYSLGTLSPFNDVDWFYPFLLSPGLRPRINTQRTRLLVLRMARRILHLEHSRVSGYRTGQWLEIHNLLWLLKTQLAENVSCQMNPISQIYPAILLSRKRISAPVSLDEAAYSCGLSRSRFSEVFKACMGIPFCHFAVRERIRAAARELQPGIVKTMKQIAFEYGFSDVSHFYRFFKKIIGCTPIEFMSRKL